MRETLRFLGLDVHAETIPVAVCESNGEVRSLGTIANREDSIRKFIKKFGSPEQLRACYEAGPTGFVLYWQLTRLGVDCAVVAPSLVPKKPGDRVKTDRRDALKLARCHRNNDLTAVWVPDEASEALRDLVRQREAAKQDHLRARHRLTKFLLRTGQRPPLGLKAWTARYMRWLAQVRYAQPAQEATLLDCVNEVEHMTARVKRLEEAILDVVKQAPLAMQEVIRGLQTLRGVAHISAVTIAAELGNISSRFKSARKLMGYSGSFPSENPSGERVRKGGITKAGNAHLRRIVMESAWCYRHLPRVGEKLRKRHQGVPADIIEIAWKAQTRLHKRYMKLTMAGKDQRKVIVAVGRELLGFIWAIGVKAERAVNSHSPHEGPKTKTSPIREKARTLNHAIQLEDKVSRSGASTKENPRPSFCDRPLAGLARVVRGSSRRIMIMRFRPANISLINRRHYLPRLLLILSSNEKGDQRTLTGHYISNDGLRTIRPQRPDQFYLPGLMQSRLAKAWKLTLFVVLFVLVLIGVLVAWFGPNILSAVSH